MSQQSWGLEVVRGRALGKVYPVSQGAWVLGNALNGEAGIDLGPEEAGAPRKMAGRQARISSSPVGLSLVDLQSPGGTFVNAQRVIVGQGRPLREGDIIQLGGIQLKVVNAAAPSVPPPAPPSRPLPPIPGSTTTARPSFTAPFRLASGTICHNWDDFLSASSKSWKALREELSAGRLSAWLAAQGRGDLLPRGASPGQNDDDRLDEWIGRIPTTRPAKSEMEIHPSTLRLKAVSGGGVTKATLKITNTGYRLLKTSLRVEPNGQAWVKLPRAYSNGVFKTPEETEIPIEVTIPADMKAPMVTGLLIEGVAGNRRVEIRLEPSAGTSGFPEPSGVGAEWSAAPSPMGWLRGLSLPSRVIFLAMALLALRGVVGLGDFLARSLPLGETESPRLAGAAVLLGVVGAAVACRFAIPRGGPSDLAPSAFAGGVSGVLLAAVAVAACRSVEPLLGPAGNLLVVACAFWAGIGAVAGLALGRSAQSPKKPSGAVS